MGCLEELDSILDQLAEVMDELREIRDESEGEQKRRARRLCKVIERSIDAIDMEMNDWE